MMAISPLYNQKVLTGIGIVTLLLLAISIIVFWENPQLVLEQTKALCQDLKSLDNSPTNGSMEKQVAVWKEQVTERDHLLRTYPSADEQLIDLLTKEKELLSKVAKFSSEVQEHKNMFWTTLGQSTIEIGAGIFGMFRGNSIESAIIVGKGMQEATEYDKKSAHLKTIANELTVENESLKIITNKVKSSLREKYKIECAL